MKRLIAVLLVMGVIMTAFASVVQQITLGKPDEKEASRLTVSYMPILTNLILFSKVTSLFSPLTLTINTLVGATRGSSEHEEKETRSIKIDKRIIIVFLIF